MRSGDRVHVLLPAGTGSLRGEVSLVDVVGLVETHDGLGASLDSLVDVCQPLLSGGVGELVHHGDERSANILALGLSPVVGKAEVGAEGRAELTVVVGKTTLGSAVGGGAGRLRSSGRGSGNSGRDGGGAVLLLGDRGDGRERSRVLLSLGGGSNSGLGRSRLLSSGGRRDDNVAGGLVLASLRRRQGDRGRDYARGVGGGSTRGNGDGGLLGSSDGDGGRTALASGLGGDVLNTNRLGGRSRAVDSGVDGLGRGGGDVNGGSLVLVVRSSAGRDLGAVVVTRPATSGVGLSSASSGLGVELGVSSVGRVSGGGANESQKAELGHGRHVDGLTGYLVRYETSWTGDFVKSAGNEPTRAEAGSQK